MKSLTQNSTMFEPCKASPGHRRYFLSFQSPNVLSKNEWHVELPRFREFCTQHLCVSSCFFSEKSRFFMEIFPEIEGPSHQPNKIHQFPCVFFSSVPQVCLEVAMHGSVKVPSRSSVSSDLVMDII